MYIALDMGTSNTRLWLCDGRQILDSARAAFGAGTTKSMGKPFLFEELKNRIQKLLKNNNVDANSVAYILTSGMAGSELGLCEIPHVQLPVNIYALPAQLKKQMIPEITTIPFLFVPGLKKVTGDMLADIMRGEETEILGILEALSLEQDAVFVLPGTHNKVVKMLADGTVSDFYTTFSGELLSSIINHSILTGQATHDFELSEAWLLKGNTYTHEHGLNAALFHIRVMAKNGVDQNALSSFLYGCVLGSDIEGIKKFAAGKPIYIGGRKQLRQAYHILLGESDFVLDDSITENAVVNGLAAVHRFRKAQQLRNAVIKSIEEEKIIAIIRNPEADTFLSAAQALYRGGIRLAEITFDRSGKIPKMQTAQSISLLKQHFPIYVGAGTVTSKEELTLAYEAGADFIISPNCDPEIIQLTRKLGLVSIPAAFTPTEIAAAIKAGADFIKLFPADQLSQGYVKAVKAPLSDAKLLAVGGVDKNNIANFLESGFTGVGVGSNLYDKALISHGDWTALEALAKEYVDAIK